MPTVQRTIGGFVKSVMLLVNALAFRLFDLVQYFDFFHHA